MEQQLDSASRISLRGVASGALVAVVVSGLILSLAGGLGIWSPKILDAEAAQALGSAERLWSAVAWIVGVFFGAYVAATTGRSVTQRDGLLHGIVTWALARFGMSVLTALWFIGAVRTGLATPEFLEAVDWRPMLLGTFFSDVLAAAGAILAGTLAARQEAKLPVRPEVAGRVPARPTAQTP